MIYPKNFEIKTGFLKIRNLLKDKCSSRLGADKVEKMTFSTDFNYIKTQLNLAAEFKEICVMNVDFPQDNYFDSRQALKKISLENTFLTTRELFELKLSLDTLKNIVKFFKNSDESKFPFLRNLCQEVFLDYVLLQAISRIIDESGEIKDSASEELKRIRSEKAAKSAAVSGVVARLLREAKSQGWCETDAEITIRDGKMLIPVSAGNKRKISGIVSDESASGKTAFIEPLESIELNNAVRALEFEERREIVKILTEISDKIRPYIPDIQASEEILAELDFARAKARLAIDMNAVIPHLNEDAIMDIRTARHPVLEMTLKAEGKKVVPLDIELNENQRIIMISGPNAGGKSVCLKTSGLVQYMHQNGLLTPVSSNSHLGIFRDIFIDIGDEQSIENDLSTYSSHLLNMKKFVNNASDKSLILIDEFGSGTEPILGGAIAEAVLERLNHKKVKGVITTHYTNLKNFASVTEGIINGAMLYDNTNMKPLFELQTGQTGNSFAFLLAKKIGLDSGILKHAEEIAGREHIDYERRIQELQEDRRVMKIRLKNLEIKEQTLSRQEDFFRTETEYTLSQRKSIIKAAKTKLESVLKEVNKKIENTILEIKNAQAEKEKTKEIRKNFKNFAEEKLAEVSQEEDEIDKKIEKLRQKQQEKAERKAQKRLEREQQLSKIIPEKEKPLQPGDKVFLDNSQTEIKILEIKDGKALLQLGQMQTFADLKRLTRVKSKNQEPEKPKVNVSIETETKKGSFLFGLDVRGLRGNEAVEKVAKYLDDAIASGHNEIKILHGTGTGALKSMIRDYLNSQLIVKKCHDEKVELGGAGITVAELDF
ncbi:MAG: Smr/MutS family protein [Bacteroidales bacterium]|nr:Smr/MutS family protein [Bacteroidales bacterium]